MEKRTIGGFIAALRKANGMTQRELAERLNVSDKTVSRWERDDGAPDLAAIPVIAEIFGVTCDELLRGERKPPEGRGAEMEGETTPKGERERRRLFAASLSKYQMRSLIATGISTVGLIAAMIGNFGFLRAYIGFFIAVVFFLAGAICQAVFVGGAFFAVADESLDAEEVGRFKWSVIRLAEWSFGLTAVFFGASLPLVIVPNDAYVGLNAQYWLGYGAIGAAAAALLAAVVCYVLNASLMRKGICALNENEARTYSQNRKLKKKYTLRLAVVLAATLLFHVFGGEMLWSAYNLSASRGTVFNDYESFEAYMEQDIPYDGRSYYYGWSSAAVKGTAAPETAVQYYDANGNMISEEEALLRTLEDKNGNIVCTYIERNENVASIRYEPKDGTVLPITVITTGDYRAAAQLSSFIPSAYCLLYPVELAVALLAYFKKRAK